MAITLFAIYFILLIILGPLAAKKMKKKDSTDYILGGRSVPLWLVTGGIVATLINSASLLGYAGSGYSLGVSAYFASFGGIAVMMWLGFWFIPKLRRAKLTTVPELLHRFFGWPHKLISVLLVACRDMGVTAGAAIGMAVVFQTVFDVTLDTALVITLIVTLIFTVSGGMWAVMITDTIQAIIILVGTTIMIPLALAYIGGWDVLVNSIPSTHWDLGNVGLSQSAAWILASALTFIGYQTLIQRGLAAESDEVAKKSFLYAGSISMLWYMVPFLVGIIAVVIFPDINADDAFMQMTTLFGAFGSIIFAIIIVASCISTLSSTILTTSSNISHDIYKQWINPQATEKSVVLVSRISVVVVAIVGTLIARSLPYILELLLTGGKIMAASLSPVLLALLFWKASRKAYYSNLFALIFGTLGTILGVILGSQTSGSEEGSVVFVWTLDPMLIGLPITLIILIFGTIIENKILSKTK